MATTNALHTQQKGKGKESIYIASFTLHVVSKCSDMDNTVLPEKLITPCLPFLRMRSSDGATPNCGVADIQLQLTTHLSTPKG